MAASFEESLTKMYQAGANNLKDFQSSRDNAIEFNNHDINLNINNYTSRRHCKHWISRQVHCHDGTQDT